ncbi:Helix-turn-helix domain protein [Pelagimonas phthalicica]|uniref:Helix-turn-helix domain protein n=1 Tax=Pelagimonas phthalicica TaxID=1037362 RepID=A0A238J8Q3_9RHOB|nr:winged helix-turn-helix domain-containing protein [Pelagimonas phthalicica]TDS94917.1 ArsR family transcriptional regulator [Pelagimonas phthalicica]SMX26557.1 Helix-turn-helix domain protein [Pelagimonas phthalicica]
MKEGPDIAHIAALIGDPARANMLTALMSGKALTATELAGEAGISAQTASTHLAKLSEGGLVVTRKQGRHKYSTLANDGVAHLLESLMGIAAKSGHLRTRTGPKDAALRKARVCYNHLAGDMGTHMYDSLMQRGLILHDETDLSLTQTGATFVSEFGIDLDTLQRNRAPLCRDCLDWSERRAHLAGSVGRAMLSRMIDLGWARRLENSRVIRFSSSGEAAFAKHFPL